MAIKMTNLSEKVIGVGEVTVLPGETKDLADVRKKVKAALSK